MKATTSKNKLIFELDGNTYLMYSKKNIDHPVDLLFDDTWEVIEIFRLNSKGNRCYLSKVEFSAEEKRKILLDLKMQRS